MPSGTACAALVYIPDMQVSCTYQAPVLNSNMFGLILSLTSLERSGDFLSIEALSCCPGNGQESRRQIGMASHDIEGFVLGDTGTADDQRDVDIGVYPRQYPSYCAWISNIP